MIILDPANLQKLLHEAFELSLKTPAASLANPGALAVGAIVINPQGNRYNSFSGADQGHGHAEELLFCQLDKDLIDCRGGILICTHEPCGRRTKAEKTSCANLVVSHGIKTVVFSIRETKPDFQSMDYLLSRGIEVIQMNPPEPSLSEKHDRRRIVLALKYRRHETPAL
jgi:pyrimidine deaminase RibD-like protein